VVEVKNYGTLVAQTFMQISIKKAVGQESILANGFFRIFLKAVTTKV